MELYLKVRVACGGGMVAEYGTDLRAWKSPSTLRRGSAWHPSTRSPGGKLLSSRTQRSSSRAAALLRLAATTIGRSDTALEAFYRRLFSRIGKQKVVTATARKIAVLFYITIYLAVIIDLFSRRVVGWAISNRMKQDLAIRRGTWQSC